MKNRTLNMENTNAKRKIEEILKDVPYHYYYNDNVAMGAEPRCGKTFFNELRQKELNCSDKAPHQEEIELLDALGLSYPQIRKVLEAKYYQNIKKIE